MHKIAIREKRPRPFNGYFGKVHPNHFASREHLLQCTCAISHRTSEIHNPIFAYGNLTDDFFRQRFNHETRKVCGLGTAIILFPIRRKSVVPIFFRILLHFSSPF